jgi:hypothetical protein
MVRHTLYFHHTHPLFSPHPHYRFLCGRPSCAASTVHAVRHGRKLVEAGLGEGGEGEGGTPRREGGGGGGGPPGGGGGGGGEGTECASTFLLWDCLTAFCWDDPPARQYDHWDDCACTRKRACECSPCQAAWSEWGWRGEGVGGGGREEGGGRERDQSTRGGLGGTG